MIVGNCVIMDCMVMGDCLWCVIVGDHVLMVCDHG